LQGIFLFSCHTCLTVKSENKSWEQEMGIQSSNQLLASSRSTAKPKASRARAILAATLAILLSSLVAPAAAFDQGNLRETGLRQQPVVMGVASSSIVAAGDWVLITGSLRSLLIQQRPSTSLIQVLR
jgi:hypothetical protein